MDLTSILGIIFGVIAILTGMVLKGASLSALNNPAAYLIIIAGTACAVMIAFPGKQLKVLPKLFKIIFTNPKGMLSYEEIIDLFVKWATESRKNGLLSLEKDLKSIDDEFIKRGLKMVIDGVPTKEVSEIMEAEIESIEDRHAKGALIFTQAGTYSPTLGVLGAVVGLIAALGNLGGEIEKLGHAISGAFIATLLGIFTGYVLYHPFANKLKQKSAEEIKKKYLIVECLLMLSAGAYPFLIESRILGALPETERKIIEEKKAEAKKNGKKA